MHVLIYALYVIWQFLEHREWGGNLKKKLGYGIAFFVAFLGIWICYKFLTSSTMQKISLEMNQLEYESVGYLEWGTLLIVFALTISYRSVSYYIKTNSK